MHAVETRQEVARYLQRPAVFAISFFASTVVMLMLAAVVGWITVKATATNCSWNQTGFIVSLIATTMLMATGSAQFVGASTFVKSVKMERQTDFRRCLAEALLAGTAFVSVQSCGFALLVGASRWTWPTMSVMWRLHSSPGIPFMSQLQSCLFCTSFCEPLQIAMTMSIPGASPSAAGSGTGWV